MDGRASTSKFQFFFWTTLILWGYVSVFARIALDGIPKDFNSPEIPDNLFWLMGLSVATTLSAKAITTVRGKPPGIEPLAEPSTNLSFLIWDDQERPALEKIQILAWTFVAGGVFVVLVLNSIAADTTPITLPDVDTTLLVLTGISQGGYVSAKVISRTGGPQENDDTTPLMDSL
jgi:hypothetical protein